MDHFRTGFALLLALTMLLLSGNNAFSQSDSVRTSAVLSAQGSLLSGSVNQFLVSAGGDITVQDSSFSVSLSAGYSFGSQSHVTTTNDLWSYFGLEFRQFKRIYPLALNYAGFAKSYGVDAAIVGGIGGGWNVIPYTENKLFRTKIIGGYAYFRQPDTILQGYAFNLFLHAKTPLFKTMAFEWLFHTYTAPAVDDMYGARNQIQLQIPIHRAINFSTTHQLIYIKHETAGYREINSYLLLGLSFKL